jgi:predicted membrane-bound dolichyl-phosphate-mannose-protein mannosyltransferase
MRQSRLFWLLVLVLFSHLALRIYSYRGEYSSRYDPDYWQDRYLRSQWVVSNSQESIGDDGLYAYAGWEYIHGRDPTTLNAEMPPLGKYFVGLSILIFGNQNLFALLSGLLVLWAFFRLNLIIFKNKFMALLPVVLFSFEPLFWQQLRAPYLDLLYLLFLLLTFIFFLRQRFFLAALFLGLMAATKASASTFPLLGLTTVLYLVFRKNWFLLKQWLFLLPISLASFALSYFRYFSLGHSLRQFLGVQKWILAFYQTGAKAPLGSVWPMLATGKWSTWWSEPIRVTEWQLTWPLLLIVSLVFLISNLVKKKFDHFWLLTLWIFGYLLFLSFVPVWPRYLLVVLPFMYNLAVWQLAGARNIKTR